MYYWQGVAKEFLSLASSKRKRSLSRLLISELAKVKVSYVWLESMILRFFSIS